MENELYDLVMNLVYRGEDSPYKKLLKKVNDIDIDYFEDITRDGNKLVPELNMELMAKVVGQFEKKADELFSADFAARLLNEVIAQVETLTNAEKSNVLLSLSNRIKKFAKDSLFFIPQPPYSSEGLTLKYEQAKKISIIEHVFQNNSTDIINFHHALMEQTVWACKDCIERRTSQFLTKLAESLN